MSNPVEIEVKLRPHDLSEVLRAIRAAGYVEIESRSFEANVLYDNDREELREKREALRVREYRGKSILTYKGAPVPGVHKQREELETTVGSAAMFATILGRLGFHPKFRYEKFRSVFRRDAEPGVITVDETPLGPFLELEGEAAWIDRTALELGFSPKDYITASYATIYVDHCLQMGEEPTHFVFDAAPGESPAQITS